METKVKLVKTEEEKIFVLSIRRQVFIEGLNIPENIEIDKNEDKAKYVLAKVDGTPAGTARWRKTEEGFKLERFAVLNKFQQMGIGRKMTEFIIKQIPNQEKIYLYSQDTAIGFYEKIGFISVESPFEEAGIKHQKMIFLSIL